MAGPVFAAISKVALAVNWAHFLPHKRVRVALGLAANCGDNCGDPVGNSGVKLGSRKHAKRRLNLVFKHT